jgi:hypothetical protein
MIPRLLPLSTGMLELEIGIFFFQAVLRIELRASHLLGRCSTAQAIPLTLFGLDIFEIQFYFLHS